LISSLQWYFIIYHNIKGEVRNDKKRDLISDKISAARDRRSSVKAQGGPKSIAENKVLGKINTELLNFDSAEVARQFFLIDHSYFSMIKPRELIDENWAKKDKLKLSPNVCKLAQWSASVSLWMASEILTVKNLTKRSKVLAHIIQIASVKIKFELIFRN
jgi:hypothetical protein